MRVLGVSTYEGVMTFAELATHLSIEENSDSLSEQLKKQRDVDKSRVSGLKDYWGKSTGTVFPNMTFFANRLEELDHHSISDKIIVTAKLNKNADRFICDGQGRTTFIKELLSDPKNAQYSGHTIALKLIITHTEDLRTPKAVKIIRQVFSDYHVSLKKPNKSVSKYFDTSTPFSRLLSNLLGC